MRWYHKIIVPLISVGVFVGSCELVCRVLKFAPPKRSSFRFIVRELDNDAEYPFMVQDPQLLWAPQPDFHGRECYHGVDLQINSAGFRDREYPWAKGPDTFRILCLGDSTTFGHALPLEETYHQLLEDSLNSADDLSGLRYEVINGGVPGYSSSQCLAMYELRGRKLSPDIVILNVGTNDRAGRPLSDDQLLALWRPSRLRNIDDFLSNLHSYRTLQWCLIGPPEEVNQDDLPTVPRVDPDAFQRNLTTLDQLCEADGCRLVLIPFVFCSDKAREHFARVGLTADFGIYDGFVRTYRQVMEAVDRERSIPLLDMPSLTTTSTPELFLDAVHPNHKGHLQLAIALEQFLREHELLPKAPDSTPKSVTAD
jgi:lysophospholipase L1-like esterase